MPRLAPVNDGVILSLYGGEIKALAFSLAQAPDGQSTSLSGRQLQNGPIRQLADWARLAVECLLPDLGDFVGLRSLLARDDLKLDRVALL